MAQISQSPMNIPDMDWLALPMPFSNKRNGEASPRDPRELLPKDDAHLFRDVLLRNPSGRKLSKSLEFHDGPPTGIVNYDGLHLDVDRGNDEEPVSRLSKVRKVAPRLVDLFRIGPPFGPTKIHRQIYDQAGEALRPVMTTRIDRGFEIGESGTWIGYKRNYFTLVLSFNFEDFDMERFLHLSYSYEKDGKHHPFNYFAMSIIPKCSDGLMPVGLVQHTPRRDKGPQFAPPVYPVVPGEIPDHQTVKFACNKRNADKVESLVRIFNLDRQTYYQEQGFVPSEDPTILRNYPTDTIWKVAKFERIQFNASIRVRPDRRISKYFTLVVELLGITEDEKGIHPVLLASTESAPLQVRGRTPSCYDKEKTSGYRDHLAKK